MGLPDDAAEARAQGWRTLAALHARIEDELENAGELPELAPLVDPLAKLPLKV